MHACGFEPYVYSVNAALSSLEKAELVGFGVPNQQWHPLLRGWMPS